MILPDIVNAYILTVRLPLLLASADCSEKMTIMLIQRFQHYKAADLRRPLLVCFTAMFTLFAW